MNCIGGPLYKIVPRDDWQAATGELPWASVDRADGFVHLSAAHQVRGTAAKHFADRDDLVIVEVDPDRLIPGTLRWEISRGGDRFPHVYGDVPSAALGRVHALSTRAGAVFPMQIPDPLPDAPEPGAVARRFEIAEAASLVSRARAAGAPWQTRGTATAADFGPGSPHSTVVGWAVDVASADDLDALLEGFDGGSPTVAISSHADPGALSMLADRGFRAVAVDNVMALALAGPTSPSLGDEGPRAESPDQGGALPMRIEHELAMLPATLSRIGDLLGLARIRGCRFAKLDVVPGSDAHRRAHEAGFRLAHVRTVFAR